jgi:hypothetical protein
MADETPKNTGDINFENNSANAGLNMDNTPSQIEKGKLTYALNAALENYDSNSINYQNEPGNEFCLNFPKDYVVIGKYFIPEQNRHIFFLSNPITGDSEIGQMLENDCIYRTIINAKCLNFDQNFPIHKVVHKINNCNTEIYWAQPNDERRYLNLDDIPYLPQSFSTPCDEHLTQQLDCNQLRIQPTHSIPQVTVVDVIIGGNLIAGTYQFAVQYSDALGNPLTSYYSVTNPTPIADPALTTVNFNYPVGKAIVVDIDNLELGGQFTFFNLAVIKTINAITSVELVGTFQIDGESKSITYSGQNQSLIKLTINDVFEKFPAYGAADDVTAVEDVLVWKGLSAPERVNYQKIANKITLLWETYKIPANENYSDELNATHLRGYLRDEVYPFEFVPLLGSGIQVDSFHIPGRAKTASENLAPDIDPSNPDFTEDPTLGPQPYWRIYNTASVIGPSTGPNINNATPYQYGNFAYWESLETYPCDKALWGDLADQPIRHHKFPDVLVSPIIESKVFSSPTTMEMGNDAVFPIGVKVDVDQIKALIAASDLTPEQKADIVGFKIVRGDRTDNKSIVAKGILRNVNKYTREDQEFYYPNYPYNDLNPDPFLNTINNAYSAECEPFNITIHKFNNSDDEGPFTEIQYYDCNINKIQTDKHRKLETYPLCSIGKPTMLGPGNTDYINQTSFGPVIIVDSNGVPFNTATIKYANFDVWHIYSINPPPDPIPHYGTFWKAEFIDAAKGLTTQGVEGFPNNLESLPNHSSYIIHVKKGATSIGNLNPDAAGDKQDKIGEIRVADCASDTPVPGPIADPNLAYRQIFNSPETSFGQPFLGDILKVESVIFGKGEAHFVEVKDNAKYRLLSADAQRIAAESASGIADGDQAAFYTAYQAYLTIYINGITRKNFAESFNSIADYNYSVSVPNNQGVKQRRLDIKRYLIPAVQSVGESIDINNYQRETSVYLRTEGSDDDTPPPLPFPHLNPAMASTPVTDHSRFTISEVGNCATPEKKEPISVVSYYASIKNTFRSQWGQIYSYQTIDTGFQVLFDSNVPQPTTVFGGDTFISRFAFKTKLPFFIDNRVGAPDDSDIAYDELGNIAYPKYWHSSRSILADVTTSIGVLENFISYKAHNFDCPNGVDPDPTPPDPNRLFYDGYFYLFAYGIPNYYVETSYNTDLRQAFNNKEGDFWPHVTNNIPDDWVQESFVSILNDNTYNYNTTYSKQNKENFFSHIPADFKFIKCNYTFPFRAVYSDPQNSTANTTVNNWLTYRASAYFDFPQNHGKLSSIDGITNRQLLARFENKTLLYNALYTNQTNTGGQVYLGQQLFTNQPPPFDFAETDLGYIGSQHKFLLKTPQGIITIDAKRGQVFQIVGTQIKDLSAPGSGMNRFFTDHLAFEILKYFPNINIDNNFKDIGINGVYDSKFDRFIITKHDYVPLSKDITYDLDTKEFYIEKTKINVTDPAYFCNVSWTLSYSVLASNWISFHTYLPNFYMGENNFFYSGIRSCCVDFDFIAGELVENPITTTTTTTPRPTTTTTSTTVAPPSCNLIGTVTLLNCNLAGTAVITVPPACKRPIGVTNFNLSTGYNITSPPSTVVSTATFTDACNAKNFVANNLGNAIPTSISVQALNLNIGSTVYAFNGTDDCTVIPDGFYFTSDPNNPIYQVVGGIITNLLFCAPTPTTTTTSTTCVGYNYRVTTYSCFNCSSTSGSTSLSVSQPLVEGKWYYSFVLGRKIFVNFLIGCIGSYQETIPTLPYSNTCEDVLCP